LRFVLIGAVGSTLIALETMVEIGVPPICLFTLDAAKSKRHSDFVDLKPIAKRYNVPVKEIVNINAPDTLNAIANLNPDYIFVIGWSQICSKEFLSIPKKGVIGYHPSLLPENRGRGVIPWTILQRKKETGSTLFWIDEGLDSGDILAQESFKISLDETATTLYRKHEDCLKKLLVGSIPKILDGTAPRIPQDHSRATYCSKRIPDDGYIDWNLPAESIWTLIRAVTHPYPGAFTFYKEKKVILWEADYIGEAPYFGLPGQIQNVSKEGALVQCGDRKHILIKKIQLENEIEVSPEKFFKNHDKLGLDILTLYRKLITGGE
jgi:methionyl-tRNA formyltransferase